MGVIHSDEDFGRAHLTEGWAREFLQRQFGESTTRFVGYCHNDLLVECLVPDKSQASLLKWRLEREKSCHFFTRETKGYLPHPPMR